MSDLWHVEEVEGIWYSEREEQLVVDPLAFTLPAEFTKNRMFRMFPTLVQAFEWFRTSYPDCRVRSIVAKRGAF